tara:strand:+ start:9228 stop:10382 length:1155 start_codon:yes stop_codon:yes gene_type:complete
MRMPYLRLFLFLGFFSQVGCSEDTVVRVGVILPLPELESDGGDSQGRESDGEAARFGFELFSKDEGSQDLEFIYRNNLGDPVESIRLVRELDDLGVKMILGPPYSDTALAAGETAQSLGVPLITPSATLPSVTQGKNYVFRACFLDRQQAKEMVKFAYRDRELRRLVTFTDLNHSYSIGLSRDFEAEFSKQGGKVIRRFYFRSSDEAKTQIDSIVKENPDVVYFPSYADEVVSVLEAIGPRWKGLTVLGADGWDTPKLFEMKKALPLGVEVFLTNHFDPFEERKDKQIDFTTRFIEEFGASPGQLSALSYDVGLIAREVCSKGASISRNEVQRNLVALNNIVGLTGTFSFDSDGNPKKSMVIQQLAVQGGKPTLEFVKRTDVSD